MRPRGIRRAIKDWQQGRSYGYPGCCILHFCWDGLIGWPAGVIRLHQVSTDPRDRSPQVVCGIAHAGGSPYSLIDRLGRILLFQWRHLQPTTAGRQRLEVATRGSRRWRSASLAEKRWASEQRALARLCWDDRGLDPELEWT